jgi:hypothetical protein
VMSRRTREWVERRFLAFFCLSVYVYAWAPQVHECVERWFPAFGCLSTAPCLSMSLHGRHTYTSVLSDGFSPSVVCLQRPCLSTSMHGRHTAG